MRKLLLMAVALSVVVACGGRQKKAKTAADRVPAAVSGYVVPKIPAMYTEPQDRAAYLAEHYWDNFDFADTTRIDDADYTEQAFTNYVQLIKGVPRDEADKSIKAVLRRASADKDMFWHFSELFEKYLFDPNSPFRDDELYILVLEGVLDTPSLDQWERIRPQEQLRMSLKNRVGTPAADFRYTLESGAQGTLYKIKSPYTLVFINNPGCTACKEIHDEIVASPLLTEMTDNGKLTVLAIYPDEDLAEWRDYAPNMPSSWINAYDRELKIKNDELYDLKAIPTLYLLDRDKRVMLKDVMSVPLIEETLYNANYAD